MVAGGAGEREGVEKGSGVVAGRAEFVGIIAYML